MVWYSRAKSDRSRYWQDLEVSRDENTFHTHPKILPNRESQLWEKSWDIKNVDGQAITPLHKKQPRQNTNDDWSLNSFTIDVNLQVTKNPNNKFWSDGRGLHYESFGLTSPNSRTVDSLCYCFAWLSNLSIIIWIFRTWYQVSLNLLNLRSNKRGKNSKSFEIFYNKV